MSKKRWHIMCCINAALFIPNPVFAGLAIYQLVLCKEALERSDRRAWETCFIKWRGLMAADIVIFSIVFILLCIYGMDVVYFWAGFFIKLGDLFSKLIPGQP